MLLKGGYPMYQKRGFTLIELLVVVLIIGILSAVALPQYEKAVKKARVATVLPYLKDAHRALQLYYLNNGTYTSDFTQLDMDLTGFEIQRPPFFDRLSRKGLSMQMHGGVIAAYTGDSGSSGWGGYGMLKRDDKIFCAEYACHNVSPGSFCHKVMGTAATPILTDSCVRLYTLPGN